MADTWDAIRRRIAAASRIHDTLYGGKVKIPGWRAGRKPKDRSPRVAWALTIRAFLIRQQFTYDELYALADKYAQTYGVATELNVLADDALRQRFYLFLAAEARALGRKPWDFATKPGYEFRSGTMKTIMRDADAFAKRAEAAKAKRWAERNRKIGEANRRRAKKVAP